MKVYARQKAAERGWTGAQFDAIDNIWGHEDGNPAWNPAALNPNGGACGIPQALPCDKIADPYDVKSQIDWGINYIAQRYGDPQTAKDFKYCTGVCVNKHTGVAVNKGGEPWY